MIPVRNHHQYKLLQKPHHPLQIWSHLRQSKLKLLFLFLCARISARVCIVFPNPIASAKIPPFAHAVEEAEPLEEPLEEEDAEEEEEEEEDCSRESIQERPCRWYCKS